MRGQSPLSTRDVMSADVKASIRSDDGSDASAASRRESCSSIAATIRRCSFSGGSGIEIAAKLFALTFCKAMPAAACGLYAVVGALEKPREKAGVGPIGRSQSNEI